MISNLLNNPLLALSAGLLDPRGTYGSFGAALNKGLLAGAQSQAAAQQMKLMQMQLDAYQKAQEDKERLAEGLKRAGAPQPAEYDQFPGEAPIQGLLNQPNPQEVMQRRMGLLQDYAMENDPMAYMQMMVERNEGYKPQSAIAKLQSDLNSGLITQEQYQQGLDVMMKPLVSMGGGPAPGAAPKPGEIYWDGSKWSRIPEETEGKQKMRGIISFTRQQNEILKEMENDRDFNLGNTNQYIENILPQSMKSQQRQSYDLEANALVDRLNVYWSGANVPEEEVQRRRRLIMVVPGDSKTTILQKQKLREKYIEEMETASNPDQDNEPKVTPPPGFTVPMP